MIFRFRHEPEGYRWGNLAVHPYKEDGSHFRSITRQTFLGEDHGLCSQLRYFEIEPDGHSTLERHEHVHGVMILQGRGHVLLGEEVHPVQTFDVLYVPSRTWHQFRPAPGERLGFVCIVNCDRDRPQRPDAAALAELRRNPKVAEFIRV